MAVRNSSEVRVYIGGFDISTAMTRARPELAARPLDKTGLGHGAETVIGGNRADSLEVSGLFEDSARSVDALIGSLVGTGVAHVMSVVIGTGTGARVYSGQGGVMANRHETPFGGLVQAAFGLDLDTTLIPARHFGIRKTTTAGTNSGSIDDTTGTSGTGYVVAQVFEMSGTLGTVNVSLQHSVDGTTWATKQDLYFTAAGSTLVTITGSLDRYVRVTSGSTTATGTWSYFGAYKRP